MVKEFAEAKVVKPGDLVLEPATGIEWAVSPELVGSKALVFGVARVPGGMRIPAHYHTSDTAAYLLRGRAALRTGEALGDRLEAVAGDYLYVGAGVIHDEETLGDEVAEFLMARDEQGGETIPVDPSDPGWALLAGE